MENQRVRLTKTMLKNGLIALLKDKDISRITVTDICSAAEINRTTFYKYYGSQYDLIGEIETDFFNDLDKMLKQQEDNDLDRLIRAFSYLKEHRERMQILISSSIGDGFARRLLEQPFIQQIFDTKIGMRYVGSDHAYARTFFSYGVYMVIRTWLEQDTPETPAEIASLLYALRKKFE